MTRLIDKIGALAKSGNGVEVGAYKGALAKFPTGVAVVTACNCEGLPIGMTVNSFVSISLEPPVVSWSLRLQSSLYGAFAGASSFVVNVLASDQHQLANQFAARADDRFQGINWVSGVNGDPVLAGVAAIFECDVVSSLIVGDHLIFFGGVIGFAGSDREPLIMHSGKVVECNEVQKLDWKVVSKPVGNQSLSPVRFVGCGVGSNFTF